MNLINEYLEKKGSYDTSRRKESTIKLVNRLGELRNLKKYREWIIEDISGIFAILKEAGKSEWRITK